MQENFAAEAERARAELTRLAERFLESEGDALARLAERCLATLRSGGKLLLFGNGGSAAQAQHLAAELVNRFERDRPALAAIALTTDGAVLSSISNDDTYTHVFARQIEALGRPGDLACAISTTGCSSNVVAGLRAATDAGLATAALLGGDGGEAREAAELAVVVPAGSVARIQEVQLLAGHLICRWVEQCLAGAGAEDDPATG